MIFEKHFLLIVGTAENLFFIIDNFSVLHEIDVCYSYENIYDLNLQNIRNEDDEDDDNIGNLKGLLDNMTTKNIDNQLKELSLLTNDNIKEKNDLNIKSLSGIDINENLQEIVDKRIYEKDYEKITSYFQKERVDYDEAIGVIDKIIHSKMFV